MGPPLCYITGCLHILPPIGNEFPKLALVLLSELISQHESALWTTVPANPLALTDGCHLDDSTQCCYLGWHCQMTNIENSTTMPNITFMDVTSLVNLLLGWPLHIVQAQKICMSRSITGSETEHLWEQLNQSWLRSEGPLRSRPGQQNEGWCFPLGGAALSEAWFSSPSWE